MDFSYHTASYHHQFDRPQSFVQHMSDIRDTYFMPINDQLDYVCRMLHEDKNFSNGLHMIGLSQGGLFVRALVQKCNLTNVGAVVSIGGPQQGIFGIPKCTAIFIDYLTSVVQAQYWHDPLKEDVYRQYSQFLADINQENLFGFYQGGTTSNVTKLEDSPLYTEDRLGLQTLDKRGDLHFLRKDGDHLKFDGWWFSHNIVIPFLN
ncbi:unnamed protein product [Trichobilharzia regenti]|nr:unnamed protein product [Trichobilharzia regenti]